MLTNIFKFTETHAAVATYIDRFVVFVDVIITIYVMGHVLFSISVSHPCKPVRVVMDGENR